MLISTLFSSRIDWSCWYEDVWGVDNKLLKLRYSVVELVFSFKSISVLGPLKNIFSSTSSAVNSIFTLKE